MPKGERRWCEYWTLEYVGSRRSAGEGWRTNTRRLLNHLVRVGHEGRSRAQTVPPILVRAGVGTLPCAPQEVTVEMVAALRDYAEEHYLPSSGRALMGEFRRFLRWAGNAVAEDDELWAQPDGEAVNRRWATFEHAVAMIRSATPRERAVIGLLFMCGMRGVEADRLLARHVTPDGPEPSILVLGKGRHGGRWRRLPLPGVAWEYLRPYVEAKVPDEKVMPVALVTIQKDVTNAAARVGLRLSPHDLRRGFGRTFWETNGRSWEAVMALQKWYGHARAETTVHYLGIRFDEMRAALAPFEQALRAHLTAAPEATTEATPEEAP